MSLKVFNTLTRKKEEFTPHQTGKVGMYVCGPTVYNYIHIGNARCYIAFDAIYRYLKYKGFEVIYVRNITDIDDKIINRAKEEEVSPQEITEKYTLAFFDDMEKLGVETPQFQPKATELVKEMIEMVKVLIDKGYAYEVDGDVFFSVTKFNDYGKLSGRTLEEMRAGERVAVDLRKQHPMDFALWKSAKPDEPSWQSPWGMGRPGWHIECSVMSLKYLGHGFDIHGGGQDLIFPHHENEIAQSEAYSGSESFVRYWLHNGFVNVRGEKMAKSVGNVVLVKELFDEYNPLILRNALKISFLSNHYRSPIDFTDTSMDEAIEAYERLENTVLSIDETLTFPPVESEITKKEEEFEKTIGSTREKFIEGMDDDFNTSLALATLFELARETNTFIDSVGLKPSTKTLELLKKAKAVLTEIGNVLGLRLGFLDKPRLFLTSSEEEKLILQLESIAESYGISKNKEIEALVEEILSLRRDKREKKAFKEADEIRAKLSQIGVEVKDTPTPKGYRWQLNLKKVMTLHGNNCGKKSSS